MNEADYDVADVYSSANYDASYSEEQVGSDFASAFGEGASRALQMALDDGNLTSEKLDEILGSFGLSSADKTYEYEQTDASDWMEERARQHAELNVDAPSQKGYEEAWERVSQRLEAGKNDYIFAQNNKYMARESESGADERTQEKSDFDIGMELFEEGRIKEAILAFEADIQKQPENADAWRMLGVCHAENDEDKKAIVCLQKAVGCDPFNVDALLALGTSYVNELDSVKALEALRAWVTHNPRFEGLKVEVDEYSDGTLMDEVIQLIMAAAAHAPDDADAQVVLGVLYNVSLDYDSAIECFKKALQLRPDDYTLYNKVSRY
jgi:peroxin-5